MKEPHLYASNKAVESTGMPGGGIELQIRPMDLRIEVSDGDRQDGIDRLDYPEAGREFGERRKVINLHRVGKSRPVRQPTPGVVDKMIGNGNAVLRQFLERSPELDGGDRVSIVDFGCDPGAIRCY